MSEKKYIHTERSIKNPKKFVPYDLIDKDLDSFFDTYEYGDVKEAEYQIWEYPSGKIFDVTPDREVPDSEYYTPPYTTKGVMWLPKLVHVETDKERVAKAYDYLINRPKPQPHLQRVARWILRHK